MTAVPCGLVLEVALRRQLEAHVRADLAERVRVAQQACELAADGGQPLAQTAWRLASSLAARVTVIDGHGALIADSTLEDDKVEQSGNHLDRPEVQAARAGGEGLHRRTSSTLTVPMLYAARPFQLGPTSGVVRVAISLAEVEGAVARLRLLLLGAGGLGLALAVSTGWLGARWAAGSLRRLAAHAERIYSGAAPRHLGVWPQPEVATPDCRRQPVSRLARLVSVLGEQRDQFAAILDSMREAVFTLDGDRRLTLINGAAVALLQLERKPLGQALTPHIRSTALRALLERARSHPACRQELEVGGRRVLARADALGNDGGLVVLLHDITDLRHLQAVRRDFVANVSHELRTPVSVMRASAETLLAGAIDDPAAARPFVEALLRSAVRLGHIIAKLLEISRADAGKLRLGTETLSWREAAGRALECVAPSATARGVTICLVGGEGAWIRADGRLLEQVLVNLLDNAVKFGAEGGRVWLACRSGRRQRVRTWVVDQGPGIEAHHLRRIFEPFYRVDGGRSRDRGGTGLGLAIARRLCRAMGGQVGAASGRRRGAALWFDLPAGQPTRAAAKTERAKADPQAALAEVLAAGG